MTTSKILREIQVINLGDSRGTIDIAEFDITGTFETKRIYYISNVPKDSARGAHAHKKLNQIFFALAGSLSITVTDGMDTETAELKAHQKGYFLPAGYWRDLSNFSTDAVCLVLASQHYDETDYIRSYSEYLEWKKDE